MLTKRKRFILSYFNTRANDKYAVLSLNEITAEVMKNTNESTDNIVDDVRNLSNLGYVRLKYDDGENFCLISTEKGRSFIDVDEESEKTYIKLFTGYKKIVGWVMASSFTGAFVGAVITADILKLVGG